MLLKLPFKTHSKFTVCPPLTLKNVLPSFSAMWTMFSTIASLYRMLFAVKRLCSWTCLVNPPFALH